VEPMSPQHERWSEFVDRLEGPEGCNFRYSEKNNGCNVWDCDNTAERPKARAILASMGFDEQAIEESLSIFEMEGGYCDCEILFNVGS